MAIASPNIRHTNTIAINPGPPSIKFFFNTWWKVSVVFVSVASCTNAEAEATPVTPNVMAAVNKVERDRFI